jgi:hypothetical protein
MFIYSCTDETHSFIRVWQTVAALFEWGEILRLMEKVQYIYPAFPDLSV